MAADLAMLWDYAEAPGFLAPPEVDPETMALAGFEPRSSGQAHGHQPASAILAGALVPAFVADFYDRIHVEPQFIGLGNVISQQQRTIRVWSAWRRSRQQISVDLENADGISASGASLGALAYGPLQERSYLVTVTPDGPAVIQARIVFTFDGPEEITVDVDGTRITAWTWEPDWARRMLERLEWRTDVLPAYRGEEQRRALRLGPRQAMEFDVTVEGDARRHMEAVLWGWGAQVFAVPMWFDQLALEAPLSAGAEEIPLDPGLRQFAVGDLVMILGETSRDHEVIEVASVSGSIGLATPTSRDWPAGTRVFPARAARLDPDVAVPRFTGRVSSARLRFEMVEPASWEADAGETSYRGYPVFEVLANWAEEDPALELARKTLYLDAGMGPVEVVDEAQIPIPHLRGRFTLTTREEIDAWRKRLFALRGKHGAIWVPSWTEDLVPVALVASNANSIDVAWLGYTEYLWGDPNRRDIRIQLTDGTVLYRRITGAVEIEAGERLSIDEPLGVDVPPEGFALVSWLMLMRQESDAAEFAWWRGDVVDTATTFRGFRHGV